MNNRLFKIIYTSILYIYIYIYIKLVNLKILIFFLLKKNDNNFLDFYCIIIYI